MEDGFKFIQEITTCFDTTYHVLQRFMKSKEHSVYLLRTVQVMMVLNYRSPYCKLNNKLKEKTFCICHWMQLYTAFPVLHAQTEISESSKPTLLKVLPMLTDLKHKLTLLSSRIARKNNKTNPHECTKLFASATLQSINNIETNYMWCAECVLPSGLMSFQLLSGSVHRNSKLLC